MTEAPFTEEELIKLQFTMAATFRAIHALPLDRFIQETGHALIMGPILDPTLYIQKGNDAERMLRIAEAFRKCRDEIKEEFAVINARVQFQMEGTKIGKREAIDIRKCTFCGFPMKLHDTQRPSWEIAEYDQFEFRDRFYCTACGWEAQFYRKVSP